MKSQHEQRAQDAPEVDWNTFKVILCFAPAVFLIVAILADSWSTVIGLMIFAPVVSGLVVFRGGLRRDVTLHVTVAMLVTYQVVLLRNTVDEPNIGLIWFLAIPALVALLGNRLHVLIWTPVSLGCIAYCWTLYATHPIMAHPLTLPNLLGVAMIIGIAAFGMITQRNRRERALKDALLAARQEAREREIAELETSESRAAITRFLGSVSHELRTPLTSIVLSVDVLERTIEDSEHVTWLGNIRSSAKSLVVLLNDVLDLAHSDAGRAALQDEAFSTQEMLDGVRAIVAPMATEHAMSFLIAPLPDVPVECVGDAARLRQVLVNLVSNALRHSGGTRIWLAVSRVSVGLHFTVGDDGGGIDPQAHREIFQPFRQLGSHTGDHERKGTGLGLTISAGYVEAMGGQLTVRSALGKGAAFEFTLPVGGGDAAPLVSAHPPAPGWPGSVELRGGCAQELEWVMAWLNAWNIDVAQNATPLILLSESPPIVSISELRSRLDATGNTLAGSDALSVPAQHQVARGDDVLRCIVCDDEPAILKVVAAMLTQFGYRAACFDSPQDMEVYLETAPADVLILDVNLGVESGLDVLRRLRSLPRTASLPVCMLSGTVDHRDACLAAGADDYLLKPSSGSEILAMLARLAPPRSKDDALPASR